MPHLIIAGAGTGGHVIPGLAVAKEMRSRGWSVSWIGSGSGIEHQLVPAAGIDLDSVGFKGLRGKGPMHALKGAGSMIGATLRAAKSIKSRKASAVLGMGGYVCAPVALAAKGLRVPLALANADSRWLLSNKALAPLAQKVFFGFPSEDSKGSKAVQTGNPIRSEIEALASPDARMSGRLGPLRVLAVGGSLGSAALNQALPEAIALMDPRSRPLVIHQAGAGKAAELAQRYQGLGVDARVEEFISDMAAQLEWCDIFVGRSGAIAASELCGAGVGSILIPFVAKTTSHQSGNAAWLQSLGASMHLPQAGLSPKALCDSLSSLDRDRACQMGMAARAASRPGAAARICDHIEQMAKAAKSK